MGDIFDDILGAKERKEPRRKKRVKKKFRDRLKFPDVGRMGQYGGRRSGFSLGEDKKALKKILFWWIGVAIIAGLTLWWLSSSLGAESAKTESGGGGVEEVIPDAPQTNAVGDRYDLGVSTEEVTMPSIGAMEMVDGAYSAKWYNVSVDISDYLVNKYDLDWNFYYVIAEEDWGYYVASDSGESSRFAIKVSKGVDKDNLYSVNLGSSNFGTEGLEGKNGLVGFMGMGLGLNDLPVEMRGSEVRQWGIAGVQKAYDSGVIKNISVSMMAGLYSTVGTGGEAVVSAEITESISKSLEELGYTGDFGIYELSTVSNDAGVFEAEAKEAERAQLYGNYGTIASSQIVSHTEVIQG